MPSTSRPFLRDDVGFEYAHFMRHRLLNASLLALVTTSTACPPPAEEVDASVDAFRVRFDAPADAFGVDAFDPTNDANADAPIRPPDVYVPGDAGPPDANLSSFDTGPCGSLDDTGLSACDCISLGTDCTSTPCGGALVCVDDGCGSHCQARSATCTAATDCPAGATCAAGGFCTRTSPTCVDSRDCAAGFSCDTGVCTDRRIGCTLADFELTCPFNFVCEPRLGAPFCVRAMQRCEGPGSCRIGSCVDVDGDTRKECLREGLCDSNADCTEAGQTCGVEPSRLIAECLPTGLCNTAADCGAGHTCVDLWGDGQRECVLTGGSCVRQSDCPAGQLCGSAFAGGAPACIDVPLTPPT